MTFNELYRELKSSIEICPQLGDEEICTAIVTIARGHVEILEVKLTTNNPTVDTVIDITKDKA